MHNAIYLDIYTHIAKIIKYTTILKMKIPTDRCYNLVEDLLSWSPTQVY